MPQNAILLFENCKIPLFTCLGRESVEKTHIYNIMDDFGKTDWQNAQIEQCEIVVFSQTDEITNTLLTSNLTDAIISYSYHILDDFYDIINTFFNAKAGDEGGAYS